MRPQRAIQRASYKEASDSESEGSNSSGSSSDLTDIETDEEVQYPIVHLPTASEVIETETLILVKEEELGAVDAEYRELKRKLDGIERKRNTMRNNLLGLKSRLSRIHTLPQEVLGYVFLFYMDDPAHSPWTLMQITRTWRATALSTRALWTKIMITSPAWQKRGASRWKDGREVCGSTEQLDRAFRRAGNAPLDIEVALKAPAGYRYRLYHTKSISKMINRLVSTGKCIHIERLRIHGNHWWTNSLNLSDGSWRSPGLKTLRLECYSDSLVGIGSPSLQQLTEVHVCLVTYSRARYLMSIPLYEAIGRWVQVRTLTSLSLNTQQSIDRASLEVLHGALENAKFLTTLELAVIVSHGFPNDPAPLLRLPNLRTLVLKDGHSNWAFDAPRLSSLTMNKGGGIPRGPPGSNSFPLLSSIVLVYAWSAVSHLEHIHVPPLHTLDVSWGGWYSGASRVMARRVDLNPVVFRVYKSRVSTSALVSWLTSMDRLEELVLEEVDVGRGLFDFLACSATKDLDSGSHMTNDQLLNCPRLIRLQLDLKGGSVTRIQKTKTAAKRAAKVRIQAGIPIKRWLVRTPDETKG